MAGSGSDII